MAGRTGKYLANGYFENITYLPCTAENNFIPELPKRKWILFTFVPKYPTGMTLSREELKKWVDYARENRAIILFDSAYEAYIREKDVPHSIYEVEGADEVAIEFRSFSKTAGFTGTRCAYTVVPKKVVAYTKNGESASAQQPLEQKTDNKFNGVPYINTAGSGGGLYPGGQKQTKETIDYYMENAKIIKQGWRISAYRIWRSKCSVYLA